MTRAQTLQGANLAGRKPCRAQTLQGANLAGRKPCRAQTLQGANLAGCKPCRVQTLQGANLAGRKPCAPTGNLRSPDNCNSGNHRIWEHPNFSKIAVVGASCSLEIKRTARCPHYKFKHLGCSPEF